MPDDSTNNYLHTYTSALFFPIIGTVLNTLKV